MYSYAPLLSAESGSNTENTYYSVFCGCISWQQGKVNGFYLSETFLFQDWFVLEVLLCTEMVLQLAET